MAPGSRASCKDFEASVFGPFSFEQYRTAHDNGVRDLCEEPMPGCITGDASFESQFADRLGLTRSGEGNKG